MPPLRSALSQGRLWHVLSGLLLVTVLGAMLGTFPDYGITLDEAGLNRYGDRLVRWYATLGANDRATRESDLYFYGGFFELVVQGAEHLSGLGVYDNRHLVNALFGLVGLAAAWGLGFSLGGPSTGFLSALFLALTPAYYGHSFANPKDIPFAGLYALGAWAVLWASDRVPRLGGRDVFVAGLLIGLAAGVRVAGIVLVGYAAVLWLGCLWLNSGGGGAPGRRPTRRELARLGLAWLGTLALGWAVMVALWPWAQLAPLQHPVDGLLKFSQFTGKMDLLFEGRLITSGAIPRSYIPKWFTLTLPEFYFAAFLLGGVGLLARLGGRSPEPGSRRALLRSLWLWTLAVLPLGWVVVRRTPLYNGHRHLLFVVPFLAVLAALAVKAWTESRPPLLPRVAAGLVLAASLLLTVVDMIQLHPYQYVYFNRLVAGGLPRAVERCDADYWGASFKEGVEWMVHHYSQRDLRQKVRVAGYLGTRVSFRYPLSKTEEGRRFFRPVTLRQRPHLVFATTAYRHHERTRGRVVHVVERQGAPLLYVFEVRPPE